MRVAFRVDSSTQVGSGHLMRCLTLAGQLRKNKRAECLFICRDLPGNLSQLVIREGYSLKQLPSAVPDSALTGYGKWLTVSQQQDAVETIDCLREAGKPDCLVIDSYAIDEVWEKQLRPYVGQIMVIDDLANRRHECDILLDQNFYLDKDTRYQGLVPSGCQLLLGPSYVLLRDEFYAERKKLRKRDGKIKNILVFYGGSDMSNETMKALHALIDWNHPEVDINVIVGESNPHRTEVEKFCYQYSNMEYYCQISNMAEFMNKADLALGAGGTTTWERCYLGLPAIVTAVAENQVHICRDCATAGYIYYIGNNLVDVSRQISETMDALNQQDKLYELQKSCKLKEKNMSVVDVFHEELISEEESLVFDE